MTRFDNAPRDMSARGEEPIREANANASPTVECAFHRAFHTRHPSSALRGANDFARASRSEAAERGLRVSCSFSLPGMARRDVARRSIARQALIPLAAPSRAIPHHLVRRFVPTAFPRPVRISPRTPGLPPGLCAPYLHVRHGRGYGMLCLSNPGGRGSETGHRRFWRASIQKTAKQSLRNRFAIGI